MKIINTYFIDVLKHHYFDLKGTATRPQFWLYYLFVVVISLVCGMVFLFLGGLGNILATLLSLALLLPTVSIAFRRLQDAGMLPHLAWVFALQILSPWLGGWAILISVLCLIVLVLCLFPSKK